MSPGVILKALPVCPSLLSCTAYTANGKRVRLVFVTSYKDHTGYLTIVSSPPGLSPEQIVSLYSGRLGIETNFRTKKEFSGPDSECQGRDFTVINAFTRLSSPRFLFMEFNRGMLKDDRTLGDLFHNTANELQAQPYADCLSELLNLADQIADEPEKQGCLKKGAHKKAREIVRSMRLV